MKCIRNSFPSVNRVNWHKVYWLDFCVGKVELHHIMREDEGEVQIFAVQTGKWKKQTILYITGYH